MIVQKYIIITEREVFSTNWFDAENHYIEGSTVINLSTALYTKDGLSWHEVEEDLL